MAVSSGGNVEGSKNGEIVEINGVKIIGNENLPGEVPTHSSQVYANNVFKNYNNKNPAIKFFDESSVYKEISWNSLKLKTLELQNILIMNLMKMILIKI